MPAESNAARSETSKNDDPLLAWFFPEDNPEGGYLDFHREIFLQPSKPSKGDIILAAHLKLDIPDNADNEFSKKVAEEFENFIKKTIFPALRHIDRHGLMDAGIQRLMLNTLRLRHDNGKPYYDNDIDLLQGFIPVLPAEGQEETLSAELREKRRNTLSAFAFLLKNIRKEGNHRILKSWAEAVCPQQNYDLLFVAYELLCACMFQIQCQGQREFRRNCAKIIKSSILQTDRRTPFLDKLRIILNKGKCEKSAAGGKPSRRFLDGLNTDCLRDMLELLRGHQDPRAKRGYVAILAKQHYLWHSGSNNEPKGYKSGNTEQLLQALREECERLAEGPCKVKVDTARAEFRKIVDEQARLAKSRGRYAEGTTDEQKKILRRNQYGEDFNHFLEGLIPAELRPEQQMLLDSWLRRPLRGQGGNRAVQQAGGQYDTILFKDMAHLWQLAVRNELPIITEIANATVKKGDDNNGQP